MSVLEAEIGAGPLPGNAADLPLQDLCALPSLQSYEGPHATASQLITSTLGAALPVGFSASDYLRDTWNLPPNRIQAVIMLALSMAPGGRWSSVAEAQDWLDRAVAVYVHSTQPTVHSTF